MSDIAKKKNETPEIEENMLISWFESKFGFLKPHYNLIAVVAGLLLVGGILGAILLKASRDTYAAQWNDLNLAVTEFANDQNTDHLTEMAEKNSGNPAGLWALQIAGDQELNMGLVKMTNPARFPKDDSEDLRNTAIRHVKKAKDTFQKILESSGKRTPLLEQRTVFSLARASESLGEWDEAKKYFNQLIESAPDSEFVDKAREGVARVSDQRYTAFYDKFSTTELVVAPGVSLPDGDEPNIDFPDLEIPEPPAAEEENPAATESTEGGDAEDASEEMKQEGADEGQPKTDEPKKETDEPKKETDEPKKETDEPKKETDEPKKETDEPKKETDEPKKDDKSDEEQQISFYFDIVR